MIFLHGKICMEIIKKIILKKKRIYNTNNYITVFIIYYNIEKYNEIDPRYVNIKNKIIILFHIIQYDFFTW